MLNVEKIIYCLQGLKAVIFTHYNQGIYFYERLHSIPLSFYSIRLKEFTYSNIESIYYTLMHKLIDKFYNVKAQ